MDKIKTFFEKESLRELLPFFNDSMYIYLFFVFIFFVVFFLLSLFTRGSKKNKIDKMERKQPNLDEIVDTRSLNVSDDNEFVDVLVAIEEEMTAIRELYVGGYISKGVYISETDRLYEKAKIFGI
tara:strand:- start:86 stop:460 length:375 start_codon:yes stop_codon:yes gene_type:complete